MNVHYQDYLGQRRLWLSFLKRKSRLVSHITLPTPSTVLHSPTTSLKKKNGRRWSSTPLLRTRLRFILTNLQPLARLSRPKQFTVFGARTPVKNVTEANIKNSASVDVKMKTVATFLHVKELAHLYSVQAHGLSCAQR
jgi:hypothetical protein